MANVDTEVTQIIVNRLTKTQLENAGTLPADELYCVDPEFTGDKILTTSSDGSEIIETSLSADNLVTDVQINGTTITSSGVANIPIASTTDLGVVKVYNNKAYGLGFGGTGVLQVVSASDAELLAKSQAYKPVVPSNLDYAVKVGVTTNINTLTTAEQTSARTWIGAGQTTATFVDWSD